MAKQANATLERSNLDVIADRGYFSSEEILRYDQADITVALPKPMTSNAKAEGRFGKQDFRYVAEGDIYIGPAGERLTFSLTTQEHGLALRRYLTKACQNCAIKHRCTTAKGRRITRWEHEEILDAVQCRLDEHPEKMRQRRETVEHPFGTTKTQVDIEQTPAFDFKSAVEPATTGPQAVRQVKKWKFVITDAGPMDRLWRRRSRSDFDQFASLQARLGVPTADRRFHSRDICPLQARHRALP